MHADAGQIDTGHSANTAPKVSGKARFTTLRHLDQRTMAARRAAALVSTFADELGGELSTAQRLVVERAAVLMALAEDAASRRLGGDTAISLDDVVRLEGAASRAVKRLGIGVRKPEPAVPTLAEHLAKRAAETSVILPQSLK
jgi:tagatose-1,6-bisphosphate aldolase non-catalytic subunit AgaZ/GatZ